MVDEQASPAQDRIRTTITTDELAELLRQRGFRAEMLADASGTPVIRSASQGILFHVRLGNLANTGDGRYLDYTFVCPLQLDAPPPADVVTGWNAGHRFARAYGHDRMFVLEMDVLLAGGVAETHLRATLEVWDHLLQQVVAFLRQRLAPGGAAAAG